MNNKALGGILLVAGTAIGAGMLALPFTTGVAGTTAAMLTFFGACAYMMSTMFCLLEANLYSHEHETNLITMTGERFGRAGQVIAWLSFLMIMYTASAAYIVAGGPIINNILGNAFQFSLPDSWMSICFAFAFGIVTWLPMRAIDLFNRFLMFGLIISYVLLVGDTVRPIDSAHFSGGHAEYMWAAIPITVLAFTAHLILPSLRQYYGKDLNVLKRVLFIGSIIPLVIYVLWQFLLVNILGIGGEDGLVVLSAMAQPLVGMIEALFHRGVTDIAVLSESFSLFALITSFVGILLSLRDFLIDALKLSHSYKHRLLVMMMAILPPLTFAECFPDGFLLALGYTGIFVAILYAIMPVMMVWHARYVEKLPNPGYRFFGGKAVLSLMIFIGFGIIALDLAAANHLLPMP